MTALVLALPNFEGLTTTGQSYLAYAADISRANGGKDEAAQVYNVLFNNHAPP